MISNTKSEYKVLSTSEYCKPPSFLRLNLLKIRYYTLIFITTYNKF